MIYGIIPARGGSKSIPLKNIKMLNGKPLIEYTIESALKSKKIDKLIVSTDHDAIINICKKYKELIVIKRPSSISDDKSPTELSLIHACQALVKKENNIPNIIVTLEPTSPLRKTSTIDDCIEILLNKNEYDSVMCICETDSCFGNIVDNKFQHIIKNQPRRRQDREKMYFETGNVYATKYETLINNQSVLGKKIYPYVVDKISALDINDEDDFIIVESILSSR